jgi:hypothetical protein
MDSWQAQSRVHEVSVDLPSGWGAWIHFAGTMLAVVGLFEAIAGLTALFDDGFYSVRAEALAVNVNYSVWGWVHLALGVLAIVASYLLVRGRSVGKLLAIGFAGAAILVNFAFLPAYPWWSTLVIAFNVLVIYAITVHGGELRQTR